MFSVKIEVTEIFKINSIPIIIQPGSRNPVNRLIFSLLYLHYLHPEYGGSITHSPFQKDNYTSG